MVYDSVYEANKYLRVPTIPVLAPTLEDNFSSSSAWTITGTEVVIDGSDSNKVVVTGTSANGNTEYAYSPLGSTLTTGGLLNFKFKLLSASGNAVNYEPIFLHNKLSGNPHTTSTGFESMGVGINTNLKTMYPMYKDTGDNGWRSDISGAVTLSTNTDYWVSVSLASDGVTQSLKIYTNEARTTQHGSTQTTTIPIALTDLKSVIISTTDFASGGGYNASYEIDDLKIYDGVTTPTPAHPDVRRQHVWEYFSGSKLQSTQEATTDTTQTTHDDDSGIGSYTGGWGSRFNAGNALVGREIRSIKVRMRCASPNTVDMTARVYGSTKATLRATSTAVSSAGLNSSYVDKTFTFPAGSRGIIQAGDHIMIVSDTPVASSGGWNCQIKGSSPASGQHFTTWQGQTNSFTEQTNRDLWFNPIVSAPPATNIRWTTTTGGASIEMNDEADSGLKLYTTSTGTNSNFTMNFDNKRQYAHDGSVCIFTVNADVQQASTTNWFLQVGLGHTVGNTGHWLSAKSAQSYLRLQTSQSESSTYSADTTVSNSPAWVTAKIENKSSSCDLSLNGTVAVTNSLNLQTSTGMQPVVYGNRGTSGSAGSNPLVCKLRYFEAYNT